MNPFWLDHIISACPLRIESVYVDDFQLTISGTRWGFNCIVPCRIQDAEKMLTASHESDFEEFLRTMVGVEIIGCTAGGGLKSDPCFTLSNGWRLEVFSTRTLEPWTMTLPKPPGLVASPGDPQWMA